jgi:hypothetical protein
LPQFFFSHYKALKWCEKLFPKINKCFVATAAGKFIEFLKYAISHIWNKLPSHITNSNPLPTMNNIFHGEIKSWY